MPKLLTALLIMGIAIFSSMPSEAAPKTGVDMDDVAILEIPDGQILVPGSRIGYKIDEKAHTGVIVDIVGEGEEIDFLIKDDQSRKTRRFEMDP